VVRSANGRAGDGSFAQVLDAGGVRIAHSSRGDLVFRPAGLLPVEEAAAIAATGRYGERARALLSAPAESPELFRAARATTLDGPTPGEVLGSASIGGDRALWTARRLQTAPWTVFVLVPEAAALRPIARLFGASVAITVAIALAALALGVILSRRISAELEAKGRELQAKNVEVERATRLKSEFLTAMSHELRTPLSSIIGFSELILEEGGDGLGPRPRRWVEDVVASARHLLALINDLLDLSKIEAGRLELSCEPLDPSAALEDAFALVAPAARRRRIALCNAVRTQRGVLADARRLRQILLNLLSNAIRFAPEGSAVEAGAEDARAGGAAGDGVRFWVRDGGPGVAPQVLARLFEPFVQGKPLDHGQGTGLGLAITRRLVLSHGGTMEVDTAPGRGATFSFTLPATALAARALAPAATAGAVLTVADDPRVREQLVAVLAPAGWSVIATGSGPAALDAVRRARPDVLLLDLARSAGAALDLVEALDAEPATAGVPVVVLAGPELTEAERARLAPRVAASVPQGDATRADLLGALASARRGREGRTWCAGSGKGRRTALVVDDSAQSRALARALLERLGFEVLEAEDGAAGVAAARARAPDLVLMDLSMPRLDGYAAARLLRGDPATAAIPVVALTAHAMPPERERALASGFDRLLVKPLDRKMLEEAVASLGAPRSP
jgi:signal transduction histidine kinase/CheY-like chemotaxis protein